MNTKLLVILGAVLGLIVAFSLVLGPVTEQPEAAGQLVDAGHFVLELNGTPILEEAYTLEYYEDDGYLLNSQGAILADGQTVSLAQQTQYDRRFLPISYHLAAETAAGSQIISAQMGVRGMEMQVQVGLSIQAAKVTEFEDLALLDNNLIGQFAVLLRAVRSEAIDRSFTAAIPQALLSLPASVEGPNTVTFTSAGETHEGKQFDLHLGDTVISLIEQEGRLVGLVNRNQETVGYDMDVYPDGIVLDEPFQEEDVVGAVEEDVSFPSEGLTLAGTLRLPSNIPGPFPVVVFVHGSGPVDRDGNAVDPDTGNVVMALDIYRQLAAALSDAGIASFRFDKRGVGESQGDVILASRADLLSDARAAVNAVHARDEIDTSRVLLIGHSEGAYLAPSLAVETADIAGIVLLAGAARPLDAITRWQVESLLRAQGVEGDALDAALAQQDSYLAFVESSQGEWFDYTMGELQQEMPWLTDETAAQLKASPLALSWLREHYLDEPAETLQQVDVPVLAISGEKDAQVPSSEAALIEAALLEGGNSDVSVHVLTDLNHLLRNHPEEPNLTYRHVSDPVDARVSDLIIAWIQERFAL